MQRNHFPSGTKQAWVYMANDEIDSAIATSFCDSHSSQRLPVQRHFRGGATVPRNKARSLYSIKPQSKLAHTCTHTWGTARWRLKGRRETRLNGTEAWLHFSRTAIYRRVRAHPFLSALQHRVTKQAACRRFLFISQERIQYVQISAPGIRGP